MDNIAPAHALLANQIEADPSLERHKTFRELIQAVPAMRRLYFAAAVRCLGARRTYYDRDKKEMVHEAEGATQMKAVVFLAAYDAGLPVQTTLNVSIDKGTGAPELEEAIASSPALAAALDSALTRARRRAPKQVGPGEDFG